MSIHKTQCIVCGTDYYYTNDPHALGIGGCENDPAKLFCSEKCFHEFWRRFDKAWKSWGNYQEEKCDS